MSEVSYQIRAQFTAADDARDAGLTSPADIVRFDDIQYGPDPVWNVLDVYRPAGAVGALPVLVSFHGGAWVYGDKERYQYFCMALAQQGFAVVNFTYRLAPEFQFPAPLEDANAVFQWIGEHAAQYGFDTDRMLRWVDFEFSPQWYDLKVKRVFYSAVSVDDMLPMPMSDKMERDFFVRYLRRIGYELDE